MKDVVWSEVPPIAPEQVRSANSHVTDRPKPKPLLSHDRARLLVLEACRGMPPQKIILLRDWSHWRRRSGDFDGVDTWNEDVHELRETISEAFPDAVHEHLFYTLDPPKVTSRPSGDQAVWNPGPDTLVVAAATRFRIGKPTWLEDGDMPFLDFVEHTALAAGAHVLLLAADGAEEMLRPGLVVRSWDDPQSRAAIPEVVPLPPDFPVSTHEDLERLLDAAYRSEPGAADAFDETVPHLDFQRLSEGDPTLARLLLACAFPVQISRPYLRAAREALAPWAPPILERDLLARHDFIAAQSGLVAEMDDHVTTALRRRLAADPDLLDLAFRTMTACHADSPSMAWENEMTWLALSSAERVPNRGARLTFLCRSAERTLDDAERAPAMARWLRQVIDRRLTPLIGEDPALISLRDRVAEALGESMSSAPTP